MLQGCKWLLDPAFQPHLKSTKTFHTKSQAFLSTAKHVLQKELKKHQVLWWWLVVTKGRFGSDDFPFHFFRWKSQVETAFCFLGFFHIFLRFHHLADDIYIKLENHPVFQGTSSSSRLHCCWVFSFPVSFLSRMRWCRMPTIPWSHMARWGSSGTVGCNTHASRKLGIANENI